MMGKIKIKMTGNKVLIHHFIWEDMDGYSNSHAGRDERSDI